MIQSLNLKKVLTGVAAVLVVVVFSAVSANAGSARRHTMEGIVIGSTLAILGATLINGMNDDRPVHVVHHNRRDRHDNWNRPGSVIHNQYPRNHYTDRRNQDRYDNGWRWDNNDYRDNSRRNGRWEIRKTWVAPTYKKIWVDGHRRGRHWVDGHWERVMVRDGYYKTEKVWVSRY